MTIRTTTARTFSAPNSTNEKIEKISRFFRSDFLKKHGLSVSATTHPVINDKLHFHVDITSHSVFPKEAVAEIENEIFARLGEKVALYVISRPQKFTSSSRHKRYDDLSRRINKKLQAQSKKDPKKKSKGPSISLIEIRVYC